MHEIAEEAMLICGVKSQSSGHIWEIATDRERRMEGWGGGGKILYFSLGVVVTVGAHMSEIVQQNAIFKLSARPRCVRSLKGRNTWRVEP